MAYSTRKKDLVSFSSLSALYVISHMFFVSVLVPEALRHMRLIF
jgi:hypothetical protein